MNNIELYAGDEKKLSRSEEIVLKRVIEWLAENNVPAVVLTNFWLGKTQIDIFVGTSTTTLQLEVKGHRRRVSGLQNGRWESTDWKGNPRTYRNGYLQALGANQTLRDHMKNFLSTVDDISYPSGVVIFDANIPHGSDLYNDKRVRICGLDQLDEVLSSPSTRPWPLMWIRDFAHKRKFIAQPLTTQTPKAPSSKSSFVSPDEPLISAMSSQLATHRAEPLPEVVDAFAPARAVEIVAAIAAQTGVATTFQTSIADIREAEYSNPIIALRRKPKPFRAILRHSPIVFALLAVVLLFKQGLDPTSSSKSTAVALSPAAPLTRTNSRHANPHRHAQKHHEDVVEPEQDTGAANYEQPSPSTPLPPAPITCPAGVDRLGCNGKVGMLTAPECPVGFHVSADMCIRDGHM